MNINIQSQIVVQTAAQWAADVTVYSEKGILVTSDAFYGTKDQRKFKIPDGVQTWSQLDYFPVSGFDDATSSIQTQINSAIAGNATALAAANAAQSDIDTHEADTGNPHGVTKSQVGLNNVDNVSDVNKPVSTAQAAADAVILSSANTYSDGKVIDSIADSDTTHAPSRNAVFDALALKQNAIAYTPEDSANKTDIMAGNTASSIKYLSAKGVFDWATGLFATIANLALKAAKVTVTRTDSTSSTVYSTKVKVNDEGIVTETAKATTADIADSLNKRYQTDAQQTNNDASSSIQTQLNGKQATGSYEVTTAKDASNGYAGLTLLKINFKNVANTITSFLTNSATSSRTYTFQNRDGTIADDTDITAAKARANHTGTQLSSTISDFTAAVQALRKVWVFANTNAYSSVTTATDEVAYSLLIQGGTAAAGDKFWVEGLGRTNSSGNNKTFKWWLHNAAGTPGSAVPVGAVQIALVGPVSTGSLGVSMMRRFGIRSLTSIIGWLDGTTSFGLDGSTTAVTNTPITVPTFASDVYLIATVNRANGADTCAMDYCIGTIFKV